MLLCSPRSECSVVSVGRLRDEYQSRIIDNLCLVYFVLDVEGMYGEKSKASNDSDEGWAGEAG